MTVNVEQHVCDGHLLKWLVAAGLSWLEHNREKVDQLNVFPVPDGDTGKNMLLTMRSAYDEIVRLDEGHVGIVGGSIAHGALMGARGNSGVILSQLWQGFADALRGYEVFDSYLFACACQAGVDAAYKSVLNPVEGTILTVSREATEAVVALAPHEKDLRALLEAMVAAANKSLQRTPELLPVLKKAGVVDSGGQGFVYILEGMLRLLNGEEVTSHSNGKAATALDDLSWQAALVPEDEEGYGYDVQFLMHGINMDVEVIRADIDGMGWSTLVVGDSNLIKVHVHVHDPGEPISYAIRSGASIDDVVVENMQEQYQSYVVDRLSRESETQEDAQVNEVAVITVASGEGLKRLFKGDFQAAYVIAGGQTMNPSTQDFLAAISSLPAQRIILLPNNKNILMAAQQAASLEGSKEIRVVPSQTIPQGISAMLAYINADHLADLDTVVETMDDALAHVITGEITIATRDAEFDGIDVRQGKYIALLNGVLIATGDDLTPVLQNLLRQAEADKYELITLYYGDDLHESQVNSMVNALSEDFPDQEFEIVHGGQPLYPFIISVE